MVQSIMMDTRCGHDFMDPSPAFERGLEVVSGKNDTTRMMIAVLTRISWVLSKNLGPRKPKCECVCVQVMYSEETTKKKKWRSSAQSLRGFPFIGIYPWIAEVCLVP